MATRKPTILIVEDQQELLRLVRRSLELEFGDYRVVTAEDGLAALEIAGREKCVLVLLDLMLPKLDGWTVCRRIREFSNVYVMIMTAKGSEEDIVAGLDAGADDYLTKPFGIPELLARVRSFLRRAAQEQEPKATQAGYRHRELAIDFPLHRVTLADRDLQLTSTEYKLLATLALNGGRVLTYQQLYERVWEASDAYTEQDRHMIQTHLNRLRKKLDADPNEPIYVFNQAGVGYHMPRSEEVVG